MKISRYRSNYWQQKSICLLLIAIFLATGSAAEDVQQTEIKCLHPSGGPYELFCHVLAAYYSRADEPLHRIVPARQVTPTGHDDPLDLSGSMDILDAISNEERRSFVGLAQSDVAYYFRNGGHPLIPSPHPRHDQVVALVRVFPEYLHVYVPGKQLEQDPQNSAETELTFRSIEGKVRIGALGSGSLITSTNILPILTGSLTGSSSQELRLEREASWPSDADREAALEEGEGEAAQEEGEGEAAQEEGEGEAALEDGRVFVSSLGHPALWDSLQKKGGTLLTLASAESRYVRNAFSHVYGIREVRPYPPEGEVQGRGNLSEETVNMVQVPALLVASKRLPGEVARVIGQFFAELDAAEGELNSASIRRMLEERFPQGKKRKRKRLLNQFDESSFCEQMAAYDDSRKKDLVLQVHRETMAWPWHSQVLEVAIALLTIFAGAQLTRVALRQLEERGDIFEVSAWVTGGIAVCICIAWLHFILFLVTWIENSHYRTYSTDVESAFVNGSYGNLLPMVLHYIASAFSAEKLFPVSNTAQFLWLSIPLLIGVSTFAGLVHVALPPALTLGYSSNRFVARFLDADGAKATCSYPKWRVRSCRGATRGLEPRKTTQTAVICGC